MAHGRTDADWSQLVETTEAFLVERAKMERSTSYTELNAVLGRRTGQPEFEFSLVSERAALGHLLGDVVTKTISDIGAMLSAIVTFLNDTQPGDGFYALAEDLGLLEPGASARRKDEFWIEQMNAVFARYRKVK